MAPIGSAYFHNLYAVNKSYKTGNIYDNKFIKKTTQITKIWHKTTYTHKNN